MWPDSNTTRDTKAWMNNIGMASSIPCVFVTHNFWEIWGLYIQFYWESTTGSSMQRTSKLFPMFFLVWLILIWSLFLYWWVTTIAFSEFCMFFYQVIKHEIGLRESQTCNWLKVKVTKRSIELAVGQRWSSLGIPKLSRMYPIVDHCTQSHHHMLLGNLDSSMSEGNIKRVI